MKKVIITGGAGFIGSHIAELLLKKGYRVVIIDNFETGRLDNISKLNKSKIQVINADVSDYFQKY